MKELYFYFYSDCLFLLVTFHSHLLYLNTGAGPKKLLKRRMRRGREGDCWTGIDQDEDDDNWDDDADQIVALATSCIVVKCTLDAHSLTKLPNYFCKQIVIINAGGGTQIQQIER